VQVLAAEIQTRLRPIGNLPSATTIQEEANGARWPSRSSKPVAPCLRGEARFDSEALPPSHSNRDRQSQGSEHVLGVAKVFQHDVRSSGAQGIGMVASRRHSH
jgi:hypothetical protein